MNDVKSTLQKVTEDLPEDASWDCLWDSVISASRHNTVQSQNEESESFALDTPRTETASSSAQVSHAKTPGHSTQAVPSGNDTDSKLTTEEYARKGRKLKIAAFVVVALGLALLALLDTWITEITPYVKLFIQVYTVALLYLAFRIHRSGRFFSQRARESRGLDARPPVLYLRAFTADERVARSKGPALTEEEQLVRILGTIGPVVALDNPATENHFPGATRISAPDEEWQQRVLQLLIKAPLVVVRLARTPAVNWELVQAKATRLLHKTAV